MNYYEEIKDKLIKNEVSKKVREYVNNKNDLTTYYEVGKLLALAGKHYGEGIIKEYSVRLQKDIGKKYNISTLFKMRKFYQLFGVEKVAPPAPFLSWSHYVEILPIKDINEISYYIDISIKENLSRNKLREKIKSKEYQRLPQKTREKLINNEKLTITDNLKDPIVLHSKNNYDKISELALKEIIMNDLDNFLKQLGEGFCYIANEYKIKLGNTYNYIDLLLFNYKYNAFVVVELKTNEVKKQDIGQIMIYKNYIDENVINISQSKTIGIIVCRESNKYVIKYSSDFRIKVTTYKIA